MVGITLSKFSKHMKNDIFMARLRIRLYSLSLAPPRAKARFTVAADVVPTALLSAFLGAVVGDDEDDDEDADEDEEMESDPLKAEVGFREDEAEPDLYAMICMAGGAPSTLPFRSHADPDDAWDITALTNPSHDASRLDVGVSTCPVQVKGHSSVAVGLAALVKPRLGAAAPVKLKLRAAAVDDDHVLSDSEIEDD